MSRRNVVLLFVVSILMLLLAACGAPASTPTPEPPTPTPTPEPLPAASLPDAQSDPMAALMYSRTENPLQSAEFTYDMQLNIKAADDASAETLAPILDTLAASMPKLSGEGAMQIVDAETGAANMSMNLAMNVADQSMSVDIVTVDGTTWARAGEDQPWEKDETGQQLQLFAGGIDPASMNTLLEDAINAEWLEDTELNGEAVHHLSYAIDPTQFDFASVLESAGTGDLSPEALQALLAEMTIDAEVWLGADDLMPRQTRVIIDVPVPLPAEAGLGDANIIMTLDMLMTYSNINEPVVIEPPAE